MSSDRHVLVCGGAGYIGSHVCKRLAEQGLRPVVLDNLSTGHRWAVKWGPLIEADLLDPTALVAVFRNHRFEAVMHFAAKSIVAESVAEPATYFRNNVVGTLNLLDAMCIGEVEKLVFSSTAAVYGDPAYTPIDEKHPTRPINPYGRSKLMAEQLIAEYCTIRGLRAVCLRYFNAAGADRAGEIGEAHDPETHLIPNIIRAALDPSAGPVQVFGDDYPTPDGTCIRDYIHVEDIAQAHLQALNLLQTSNACMVLNLGSGSGYSITEVLHACRRIADGRPESIIAARRDGDPAILVADGRRAVEILALAPPRGLDAILASAWNWHSDESRSVRANNTSAPGSERCPRYSLTHLGQSGFRLHCDDTVVYLDPYLSDYVERKHGPEMRRLRPTPIPPETIRDADWVLVSHIHADHCDPDTLKPIADGNPGCRFLGTYEVTEFLASALGIDRARLVTAGDERIRLSASIEVLPIPAAHPAIERNEQGLSRYAGFLMVIDGRRIYHSGDCSVDPEIVARLQGVGPVDLALLPVNECNYYRQRAGIVGNMSIRDAFGFAAEIRATTVVPMHYDMFAPNCVYEEEILAVHARLSPPFRLLMPHALEGY